MTCPACGGTMRLLPAEDAAVCRKCWRRQTGEAMAAKAEPPSPKPEPQPPPLPKDYEPFDVGGLYQAMRLWYAGRPGMFYGIDAPHAQPRSDGMDPANAYLICGECRERWDFPDLALGDCVLLPCQHGFLLRDEQAAGKAGFWGPGADYRVTMEPPE